MSIFGFCFKEPLKPWSLHKRFSWWHVLLSFQTKTGRAAFHHFSILSDLKLQSSVCQAHPKQSNTGFHSIVHMHSNHLCISAERGKVGICSQHKSRVTRNPNHHLKTGLGSQWRVFTEELYQDTWLVTLHWTKFILPLYPMSHTFLKELNIGELIISNFNSAFTTECYVVKKHLYLVAYHSLTN